MALTETQVRSNFATKYNNIRANRPYTGLPSHGLVLKPSDDGTINLEGISNKMIYINPTTWTTDGTNSAYQGSQGNDPNWPRTRCMIRVKDCHNIHIRPLNLSSHVVIDGGYTGGGYSGGGTGTLNLNGYNNLELHPTTEAPLEAQHGFWIQDSTQVLIEKFEIKNVRGDIFYINGCENIFVEDCRGYDNGRQGLVVIGSNKVIFEDCVISQVPRSMIDIENNSGTETAKNIIIRDCKLGHRRFGLIANHGDGHLKNLYFVNNSGESTESWFNDGRFSMSFEPPAGKIRENIYIFDNDFSKRTHGAQVGTAEKGHISLNGLNNGDIKELYVFDNQILSQISPNSPPTMHTVEIFGYDSGSGTPSVPLSEVNIWNNTVTDGVDGIC